MELRKLRPLRYIRKNFDWKGYVEANYTSIKYAGSNELRICCPACGDKKHKLYINDEKNVFHCFKCAFTCKHGRKDVFDFVAITEGISKGQATIKLLREYKPVTPEDIEAALAGEMDDTPEQPKKFKHAYLDGLPAVAKPLAGLTDESAPFWNYLKGRGLTDREITNVINAHYVPDFSHKIKGHNGKDKGDIGRRILWPIYGGDNKLVSWQGRAFEKPDDVKYFFAPDTEATSTLWPYVPPRPGSVVVLSEGVLDVTALRRMPKEYSSYATFSKHISKDQIQLLLDWGVKDVILFWDPDAKREIRTTVKTLKLQFNTSVPSLENWPTNIDCGDCLLHPEGFDILCGALDNAIDVNSLDYLKWEIE